MNKQELKLHLQDTQWPLTYIDHDRNIVRAIVIDEKQNFYFVRAKRNDDFGEATLIETSGGGVEARENLETALKRELKEELGAEVEIITKIGVVSDYYNLIHRHNINNYYLCKVTSFGEKHLTKDEIEDFNLSTLRLSYRDAEEEYKKCAETKIGKLIAARELPVLKYVKKLIDEDLKRSKIKTVALIARATVLPLSTRHATSKQMKMTISKLKSKCQITLELDETLHDIPYLNHARQVDSRKR